MTRRIAYENRRREGMMQAVTKAIDSLEPAEVGYASDVEEVERALRLLKLPKEERATLHDKATCPRRISMNSAGMRPGSEPRSSRRIPR